MRGKDPESTNEFEKLNLLIVREEANAQFKRDWLVEEEILSILRERMHDCFFYEKGTGLAHMQVCNTVQALSRLISFVYFLHILFSQVSPQPLIDLKEGSTHICKPIYDAYQNSAQNYFIKYGEVSNFYGRAEDVLAKQKHRIMWERRHGPVGSGMKSETAETE